MDKDIKEDINLAIRVVRHYKVMNYEKPSQTANEKELAMKYDKVIETLERMKQNLSHDNTDNTFL